MIQPDVLWLGDPACHQRELVGGKAAHLSRLADSYRVPPGFCISHGFELGSVRGRIDSAYGQMAMRCGIEQPSVAVRSSAVDEDGSAHSFAGLHETYLNLAGPDAIAEAAARCWDSGRSERALAYRRERGLPEDEIRLAVLVQQLVPADCAVVAFSGNPVTGSRDEILIEANWGLGESIASGIASPDTFTFAKRGLRLRSKSIGAKGTMTVPVPGGTREVETPKELRTRAVLDGTQVREVAELVLSLESWMGQPVDVECAYAGGLLYVLQCRAATGSLASG